MTHAFPWFAIHKDTRYIVAGFNEYTDAERFCALFAHGKYVVRSGADLI